MRDARVAKIAQELDRARQRAALGKQLAEELTVALLDQSRLRVRQGAPDLAGDGTREEPAAHADPPVDLPAVDGQTGLRQSPLPSEDVPVHGVHQGPVQVE